MAGFVMKENRISERKNLVVQSKRRFNGSSHADMRVHHNSDLTTRLDASEYTQWNQAKIGSRQDHSRTHEIGHVVQQKLGMVRANGMYSGSTALNANAGLEHQTNETGAGKAVAIIQRMGDNVVQRCPPPGPYAGVKEPRKIGAGKSFSQTQKKEIYKLNMAQHGGQLTSDLSGMPLVMPKKSRKGETPPENEAQLDHIKPRKKGGTNSSANAQVLSRKENRDKWDKY